MTKVFLSYSRTDSLEIARELHRRLIRDGVECFIDEKSISWGENFVVALEDALNVCDHFICLLTPGFVNSEWTKLERTSITLEDPSGSKRKILPLIHLPCEKPHFLKPLQHLDVTSNSLFEESYPEICKTLGGVVRPDLVDVDRVENTLPGLSRLPEKHRMPYKSLADRFSGRLQPLYDIHQLLREGVAVVEGVGVIAGTGGLGKTQLAIEYVHRFAAYYQGGVYWVNAEQQYESAIAELATHAGIDIDLTSSPKNQAEMVWRKLSNAPNNTLIIYDNFPENESLQHWLPVNSTQIKTLITTRRQDLAAPKVTLQYMDDEESQAILNSRERRFTVEEASPLVSALGGLPLALELTSNYLNLRRDISISQLVVEMNRIGDVMVLDKFSTKYRDELPSGHEKSVNATFQISWNQASEYEKCILQFMAYCGPAPIPRRLLHAAFDKDPVSIMDDPIEEAIENLVRLSLVDLDNEDDPYIHRLFRDFVRAIAPDADIQFKTFSVMKRELIRATDDSDISAYKELIKVDPHARNLTADNTTHLDELLELHRYLCWYDLVLGRYESAHGLAKSELMIAQENYPSDHIAIALSQSDIAVCALHVGENEDSLRLAMEALPTLMKNTPSGHSSISVFENLAIILKELNIKEEAKQLLLKVLEAKEQTYDSAHPETAKTRANLGIVLHSLGELGKSRVLLEKALSVMVKRYPEGDVAIAKSQANLASVLNDMGEARNALNLLDDALPAFEKHFKPKHIEVAKVKGILSDTHAQLGNFDDVRRHGEDALDILEKDLPHGHLKIADIQAQLASAKKASGDLEGARSLYEKSLPVKRKHYPDDLRLANTLYNYSTVLLQLEDYERSIVLLREALNIERNKYPADHPQIARTRKLMGILLHTKGDKRGGMYYLEKSLKSMEKHFPPNHPELLSLQRELSNLR